MPQQLRWALCDQEGLQIVPIEDFEEDQLTFGVNDIRNGTVTLSLEDSAVPYITVGQSRLKAWMNDVIVLNAPVFLPDYEGSSSSSPGTVTIAATDNIPLSVRFTEGFAKQTAVDQSEIMARLVEEADATVAQQETGVPSHGIIRGTLPASVLRDRTYYDISNPIWELLINLTQVIGGPDFELEPLDRDDGVFMALNTFYPQQGSDKTGTVFLEYGTGALNADEFGWQPSTEQLVNRYIFAGATPEGSPTTPAWISENLESQQLYGIYEAVQVDPEVSVVATMKEHADAVIASRAYPLNFFTVQPAVMQPDVSDVSVGIPPRFGPPTDPLASFWLGDIISVVAREGVLSQTLTGRVVAATVETADNAGNVDVSITFGDPVQSSGGISGHEANLTLSPPAEAAGIESTVETDSPAVPEPGEPPVNKRKKVKKPVPFHRNADIPPPRKPKKRR